VTLHKAITASTEEGRKLFEAGLADLLNFGHEAAIANFRKALEADPGLVMAHWAIALAIGPHYNMVCGLGSGFPYVTAAMAELDGLTGLERDLIRALSKRSSKESHDKVDPAQFFFGTTEDENKAYAEAMKAVAEKYPDNVDVTYLYAEALMNLNPWKLWTKDNESGDITATDATTLEIVTILESALATEVGAKHPGIIHLYVHALELSATPEKALPAANVLRTLMPDYGHLTHMPSHIDAWVGAYEDAILANVQGCAADDAYVARAGNESEFYKFYRLHNRHFLCWAAMFDGQSRLALEAADAIVESLPVGDETKGVSFVRDGLPMGQTFFEGFRATKYHVWIRFGMWAELLAEPLPEPPELFPATIAVAHYARGVAFASTNRVPEALEEQQLFLKARLSPDLREGGRVNHNAPYYADDGTPCILGVAEAMLDGEIAYRVAKTTPGGDFATAFAHLREAVKRDEALAYDEPWPWMVPTRHALGALLLEQNHAAEAADVYRRDLKAYPKNMWALLGLKNAIAAGAPAKPDDGDVAALFAEASKRADVKLEFTCFCAGVPEAKCPK